MQSAEVSTHCPSCAACISVSDPSLAEAPRAWWDACEAAAEVACPLCGWEFAVDQNGRIIDDGGLDPEGPFEVGPEGDLLSETLLVATCPACNRRFEVGEPGVTQCPGCRHSFLVDEPIPPVSPGPSGPEEWDEEEAPYGEPLCPACGSDGDLDNAGFVALEDGWVICQCCGWEFRCAELFQDLLQWQHEEQTYREDAGPLQMVVAADGSGDCTSLTRALGQVLDGGIILVRPGVYAGPAQLAVRRLTLRGEGPAEEIRLMGGLEAVGSRLRLRGLTLTGTIKAHCSRLRLQDCIIREATQSGLEATGAGTEIRMRACRIEHCRAFAVMANLGTVVRLSNCTLAGNADGGIQMEEGAWAQLRGCRITGNGGDGVRAGPQTSVFVHRCVLAENDGAGLALHGSRAVVTRCQFLNQTGSGVLLGSRGRLLMRRCEVCQGKADGLEFGRRTRALVCDCEVFANAHTGLSIDRKARVVVTRCSVTNNGTTGIYLAALGQLSVRSCACRDNREGDWDIEPAGSIRVAP